MQTVAGYPAFSSTDLSVEEGAHWKTVVIVLIYHLLIMYLSTPTVVNWWNQCVVMAANQSGAGEVSWQLWQLVNAIRNEEGYGLTLCEQLTLSHKVMDFWWPHTIVMSPWRVSVDVEISLYNFVDIMLLSSAFFCSPQTWLWNLCIHLRKLQKQVERYAQMHVGLLPETLILFFLNQINNREKRIWAQILQLPFFQTQWAEQKKRFSESSFLEEEEESVLSTYK